MANRLAASAGSGARTWVAAAVIVIAALSLPALAWAVTIQVGGEVYKSKCTPCHATIADGDDDRYAFSHGNHITFQCSSCHRQFPHRPEGTLMPVMKDCFNCHGVTHGPQGRLASGACVDCHGARTGTLRPPSHTADWAATPHVAPAEERLTTECSLCHSQPDCDACHAATGVAWAPPAPMVYDAGTGCLACHGSPNLVKTAPEGLISYQVTGLDTSAHRDLTCMRCHTDFGHGGLVAPTNVWFVNAGLSCADVDCHENKAPVAEWGTSIHGTAIASGDLTSATCGSCHGSHDIQLVDTAEKENALHLSSEAMCASCHRDRWDNYDDGYHGRAYKAGALDAPACWDCHAAHDVRPASDPESLIYSARLAETCASCHQHAGAGETFARQTADLIHQQEPLRERNPINVLLQRLTGGR